MRNKKLKLNFTNDIKLVWDIGNFPVSYAKGEIEVDSAVWEDYVEARKQYEIMHSNIVELIQNKMGDKKFEAEYAEVIKIHDKGL